MNVKLEIKGKVQGVGFRYATKEKALDLKVTGIVKNDRNGSVQVQASGLTKQIISLIDWCKLGPEACNVEEIFISYTDEVQKSTFKIVR